VAAEESGHTESGGLLQSLRTFAATLVALLQTRLELLAVEVEEERTRVRRLLLLAAVALFFLALALLMLTLFVVVLFWDTYRLPVIGALTALYLMIGLVTAFAVRRQAATRSRLFSASLAELAKDREQLTSQ
jgi:uncharacterized membrane protein YqjE